MRTGGDARVRARSKAETQERILEAASQLFLARGFEHTSVSRIAERAGVSRAAIFWHFGSKAALVYDTLKRFLAPFRERLHESSEQRDAKARLFELFDAYENFVAENRVALIALVRWCLESPEMRGSVESELLDLHAKFARDVRESLTELLPEERDVDVMGLGLVSLLDGNLLLDLVDPEPALDKQRREALRTIVRQMTRGGAPRAGGNSDAPKRG